MIKYKMKINEGGYPSMGIEEKYEMLWELGSCSHEYIRNIVNDLEDIRKGTTYNMDFGSSAGSTIVFCGRRKGDSIEKNGCWINYGWGDNKGEIRVSFNDIYNLMNDWKDYLDKWEKETGLIKQ